jgi:hypothetical protein
MPSDFSAVLGIAGTNLQNNNMSGVINKWAKFKPIPYEEVGILTDAQRASGNYGLINIPTWSNINKMANFWLGIDATSTNAPDIGIKSIYWGYRTPTGGLSEPFRLADWSNEAKTLGYYHEAEAPVGGSEYTSYTIESSGHLRISFKNGAQDVRTIKLNELTYPTAGYSVGNMYFGVIMKKQGSSTVYAVTGPQISNLPSQGAYVDIYGLGSSYNGTWDIFPMASADQITFTSSLSGYTNGKFIALNEVETVGIGATVVRMDVMDGTLYAMRDTSQSTRILYTGCTVVNTNSPQGTAKALFEVFDVNNNLLASNLITTIHIQSIGGDARVIGNVDMGSIGNLRSAFSVRVTITPTNVTNYGTSSDDCTVSDGPSPYA